MVKHTRHKRRGMLSGIVMSGLLGRKVPFGVFGKVAAGAAMNEIDDRFLPDIIPAQDLALAGILFGLPGLGGAVAGNILTGRGVLHAGMGTMPKYGGY